MLNLLRADLSFLSNGGKCESAVMGSAAEDSLSKSRKVNLLAKVRCVTLKEFMRVDTIRKALISCKIAPVESEEQISHPSVLALCENIEDRMKEKFSEVVDASGDESRDAEVVSSLVSLVRGEFVDVDTCEVEEGSAVVVREVHLALKEGLAGFK